MKAGAGILVVEDDDGLRAVLLEVLKVGGYEACGAENGQVAWDLLRQGLRPGVMLVDLKMPIMNGWKCLERCDQDPELKKIPRIVISVFAERLREVVAHAHLPKPVNLNEIVRAVEKIVQGRLGATFTREPPLRSR